ncbi:MAG: hypothetical protein FWG33_04675 [Oscillospiraceae bacterium]|nr:hypothetical protein [Oscillospiraceae bacterium]
MKKITAIILTAALILCIAGCEKNSDTPETQQIDVSENEPIGMTVEIITESQEETGEPESESEPEFESGLSSDELAELFWSEYDGIWQYISPEGKHSGSFITFIYSEDGVPSLWGGVFVSEGLPVRHLTNITQLSENEYRLNFIQPAMDYFGDFLEEENSVLTVNTSEKSDGKITITAENGNISTYIYLAQTLEEATDIWSNQLQ